MPCGAQFFDDPGHAWDDVGEFRRHRAVLRNENVVNRVDVAVIRRMSVLRRPGGGNSGQGHQRGYVRALRHPHRAARLVDRNVHSEVGERLDEDPHRRQRAVIDDRAGPVEHDGAYIYRLRNHACPLMSSTLVLKRSAMTSSAMAKDVLAPVPPVMTTRRTFSEGASANMVRFADA